MFFFVIIIVGGIVYFLTKSAKESLFKSTCVNTFYYFTSTNGVEHRRVCKFYHDRYTDGTHRLRIDISDANPMLFNMLGEPIAIGNSIMFDLNSTDNTIQGIKLMMLENTAHISFPDDTIIHFR